VVHVELTLCAETGPSLRFHMGTVIALAGAEFHADIDGVAVPFWTSVLIKAGSVLTVGTVREPPWTAIFGHFRS